MDAQRKKFKNFLFDMDGVLLNSEPLHHEAKERMLGQYGIAPDGNLGRYVGVGNVVFWDEMIRAHGLAANAKALAEEQARLIARMVAKRRMPVCAGLTELMAFLDERGVGMAVVSSSPRVLVEPVLAHLGIGGRFRAVVTGDEVERVKPDPDLYQLALRRLDASPKQTAAIEDSRSGIQAAQSAGIFCVGYVNPTSGAQDLSRASARVTELIQIKNRWDLL